MFLKIIETSSLSKAKPSGGFYYVRYGTHRMAAVLILLRKKKIAENLIVGSLGVGKKRRALTAGELKKLFSEEQLYSLNTYFYQHKVNDLVENFDINKLFDERGRKGMAARDEGLGIWITQERAAGRREFKELRDTHRDVEELSLSDYLRLF
jgi:hypothetical protein